MVKLSRTVTNGELVEAHQYWDRYWVKFVDLRFPVRVGTQTGMYLYWRTSALVLEKKPDSFNQSAA